MCRCGGRGAGGETAVCFPKYQNVETDWVWLVAERWVKRPLSSDRTIKVFFIYLFRFLVEMICNKKATQNGYLRCVSSGNGRFGWLVKLNEL